MKDQDKKKNSSDLSKPYFAVLAASALVSLGVFISGNTLLFTVVMPIFACVILVGIMFFVSDKED